MRRLLSAGADVNMSDKPGMTALFHAVTQCRFVGNKVSGQWVIVHLLLEAGADPTIPDRRGEHPLEWAIRNDRHRLVELMRGVSSKKDRSTAPVAGSKEAKERADQLFNHMLGIEGKATISKRGHPVCSNCGCEFPVSAQTIREESDGTPTFVCPSCKKMVRL
jgi:ankyrin repeat protein